MPGSDCVQVQGSSFGVTDGQGGRQNKTKLKPWRTQMITKSLIAAAAVAVSLTALAPVQQAQARVDVDINLGLGIGFYPGYGYATRWLLSRLRAQLWRQHAAGRAAELKMVTSIMFIPSIAALRFTSSRQEKWPPVPVKTTLGQHSRRLRISSHFCSGTPTGVPASLPCFIHPPNCR